MTARARPIDYAIWITRNVPASCVGLCAEATERMVGAFPELRRVRGHLHTDERPYPHWWCVAPDGTIVDPTAAQFRMPGHYVEHEGPEPIGKCYECGGHVFDPRFGGCCSAVCADAYVRYLQRHL